MTQETIENWEFLEESDGSRAIVPLGLDDLTFTTLTLLNGAHLAIKDIGSYTRKITINTLIGSSVTNQDLGVLHVGPHVSMVIGQAGPKLGAQLRLHEDGEVNIQNTIIFLNSLHIIDGIFHGVQHLTIADSEVWFRESARNNGLPHGRVFTLKIRQCRMHIMETNIMF